MRLDIHFHAAGIGSDLGKAKAHQDIYRSPAAKQKWFVRLVGAVLEDEYRKRGGATDEHGRITTDGTFAVAQHIVSTSDELDGAVLLALDGWYTDGALDPDKTEVLVTNRYLAAKIDKPFFFGASVNPNRRDWEAELDWVIESEAVLMKWIPSVQNIVVDSPDLREFYSRLSRSGIPLLCHSGPEFAFSQGPGRGAFDDYRKLEFALDLGVKVIVAHCAMPMFPSPNHHEARQFLAFMKAVNGDGQARLWADTSAIVTGTHVVSISEIVHEYPPEWLVHGSDFPIPVDGWAYLPWITHDVTPAEYWQIVNTRNPLDRDVRSKRAMGLPDSILENWRGLLRMPESWNRLQARSATKLCPRKFPTSATSCDREHGI